MGSMKDVLGDTPLDRIPHFDGETYNAARDHKRLGEQHLRVWEVMKDGKWHSLAALTKLTGAPGASVSARIRDFRKNKFGGHKVERKSAGSGTFMYRLTLHPLANHSP